jgi:hypothetical protein
MRNWQIVIVSMVVAIAVSYVTWTALAERGVSSPYIVHPEVNEIGGGTDPGHFVLNRVDGLRVTDRQEFGGLTVFPVVGRSLGGFSYLTFDEAMNKGVLIVSEKGDGEVNMVRVRNKSSQPVFIMDGEEIVGARQNRVLNSSVMIPATDKVVEVPVSCVEHGRWVGDSMQFQSGGTQLFAAARQANVQAVTRNYAASPSAGPQSDQSMIWERVGRKRAALSVGDASGPMHEAYKKYDRSISDYVKRFHAIDGQV